MERVSFLFTAVSTRAVFAHTKSIVIYTTESLCRVLKNLPYLINLYGFLQKGTVLKGERL